MKLYVIMAFALAIAIAAEAQNVPKKPRVVPPECKWGTTWPSYDPTICGVPTEQERREEILRRRSDYLSMPDGEFCVISPATDRVPICVFKDLDSCKRASRDDLWRKSYPDAEWCKPRK